MRLWQPGEIIVRREIWRGRPRIAAPWIVVKDGPQLLVTYLPEGSPFGLPDRDPTGLQHPYAGRHGWSGHGILALHRPADAYAVMVFWKGPTRDFWGWYINFQAPYRRTKIGFDTLDHELDLWSEDGRSWRRKDFEVLDQRVADGIFTPAEAAEIRTGAELAEASFVAGHRWWDDSWAGWTPPDGWTVPVLPGGWEEA
jgi:hypothetical protein